MVNIITYSDDTKHYIRDLNYEWLQKYFCIEPNDELQLNNPDKEIINKGSLKFYVTYKNIIAGTATLIPEKPGVFELGKMAVTQSMQGKGLASALLKFCIDKAMSLNASKMILYSNTKLTPAISLYRKFGFYEVKLEKSSYLRCNIKMEKML
ncbi:MAG: GNAT family N-acetyltransferase [Ferruginibacter sp.]